MSTEQKSLTLPEGQARIAKLLNTNVLSVIGNKALNGFERAFMISSAIQALKDALTPEYMKPIMALQGNKLGFKTDRDDKGGYPIDVVKNCLIEAVLMGLQPHGNQFNIIAGNTYATKEGCGYLLSQIQGLKWEIIPGLPRVNNEKTGAAILMKIKYSYNGPETITEMDVAVKMNAFMGTDAIVGKATRKARKWLYDKITGSELPEGDAQDVSAEVISSKIEKKEGKEANVANTMSAIAKEAKANLGDDPSRVPPEDVT